MPGCDETHLMVARKASNAGLATLERGRIEKVVSRYVTSPMLVGELKHIVKTASE